jgi:predicted aldo/keto reductase-like oxidoreductase
MEAFAEARQAGKARFAAVSGHGRPAGILYSVQHHPYDVLMTGFNYLDRFNFPQLEGELLALCHSKGVGLLGMKALADGYLHRDPGTAIRYTLSLPIASLVVGINSREFLLEDLRIVERFTPLSEKEKDKLYSSAPELGDYVCRLCGKCSEAAGFDPRQVFLLEGLFDRQMDSQRVMEPAAYALQERLKHWFDQAAWAREEYSKLPVQVDPGRDYRSLNRLCPYGIDIERKLKIAHGKLTAGAYLS